MTAVNGLRSRPIGARTGRIASRDLVQPQAPAPEAVVRRGWPAWPSDLRHRLRAGVRSAGFRSGSIAGCICIRAILHGALGDPLSASSAPYASALPADRDGPATTKPSSGERLGQDIILVDLW